MRMLDAPIAKLIDPPLDRAGAVLAGLGLRADWVTWSGFGLGLCAVPAIATGLTWVGLGFIALNRLFDGLDGAMARHSQTSDAGAFLDTVLDFIFYPMVPFAFALAEPDKALAAAFLILGLVASGSTFLAYAVFAGQPGQMTDWSSRRAGGLDSETFLAFVLACIFPSWFSIVAYVFGTLCFITGGMRIAAALVNFRNT